MKDYEHLFYIPVMGTGFTIDSPLRIAPFGLNSVVSLVDDHLIEEIRKYYCQEFNIHCETVNVKDPEKRSKRITLYLDLLHDLISSKINQMKQEDIKPGTDSHKYFELLPEESKTKIKFKQYLTTDDDSTKQQLAKELKDSIRPGSIDVNIMTKFDTQKIDAKSHQSDAMQAFKGFANSKLDSSIIFSAGLNPKLYDYITQFKDFIRDEKGYKKKKVVLKVTDYRSALIQTKFLAKKGIEVHEFRVESGLNCGGHAFSSKGKLLPEILEEFKQNRESLKSAITDGVEKFYKKTNQKVHDSLYEHTPLLTVQGGVGSYGEILRLKEEYEVDLVGIGSPFLLVEESSCLDDHMQDLLAKSKEDDLYISQVSPLGVHFNHIKKTPIQIWTDKRFDSGHPGAPCRKGYLAINNEFDNMTLCTASETYQKKKIKLIQNDETLSKQDKEQKIQKIKEKLCICDHLANSALIALGIKDEEKHPQCICPGPNIAFFNKLTTLKEMVDHFYGRDQLFDPHERPHMFFNELKLNIDFFESIVTGFEPEQYYVQQLDEYKKNLNKSFGFFEELFQKKAYPNENIQGINSLLKEQKSRLEVLLNH